MVVFLAAISVAGCATQALSTDSAIVGTWTMSTPNGTCSSYTFRSDGSMTFDDGIGKHLDGGYLISEDGNHLALSFDGEPTVVVAYSIGRAAGNPPAFPAYDTLTITDDPATVPAGAHRDVVYGRHPCSP